MLMNIACDVKFEVESKTSSCLHELSLGFRLQLSRKASVIQLMKVQESSREKNHPRCQRRLIKQVPVAAFPSTDHSVSSGGAFLYNWMGIFYNISRQHRLFC